MKSLPYILIFIIAFALGWCSRTNNSKVRDSDTITLTNTYREVYVDTQYIFSPQPYLAWIDNSDTIYVNDTCFYPREYKEYKDSNYYAKISGIMPRLDEIRVYPKTIYETKYVYRDIVKKSKRFGLGISAGYGICKDGFSPVISLSLNYNLFNF